MTLLALVLLSTTAAAEPADFAAADKYLHESSFARACDGFDAFLKANPSSPYAREAKAKRTHACVEVGRANWDELYKLADTGEKDFARAYASWVLAQRGIRNFELTLPLLEQAIKGDDRAAKEARTLFIRGALLEMERSPYDHAKVRKLAEKVLDLSESANEKARARLLRAHSALLDAKNAKAGESELREIGSGNSEWADDALYALGQRRENQNRFNDALEAYDEIVKRFSATTSNQRENAISRAADVRRPYVQLSVAYLELPGMKPQVSVTHRNVTSAHWEIHRVDPSAAADGFSNPDQLNGPLVSQWDGKLVEPSPHQAGSAQFEADLREVGAYVLQITADGTQVAREFFQITPHLTLLKAGSQEALTWTVEAETGKAISGAEVTLFAEDQSDRHRVKLTAQSDAQGLARFDLSALKGFTAVAWSKAQGSFSQARSSSYWYGGSGNKERLAWVLTDRPLYKPSETVGFKVFLRAREDGPSSPVPNETFTLSIHDPTGREVAKPSLTSNAFGTATFQLKLGSAAQLGAWSFYVSSTKQSYQLAHSQFRVEEYKPPEYTVSVAPLGKPKPGEAVKFKVSASFFFGGPVANAQGRALVQVVPYTHRWKSWPDALEQDSNGYGYEEDDYGGNYKRRYYGGNYGYVAQQKTLVFKTGDDGTAEVEYPALQVPQGQQRDLTYQVQVFVTDSSRREVQGSGTINVSATEYFVDLRTDRFLYKPGERVQVKLRSESSNGEPTDPQVQVRLIRLTDKGPGAAIANQTVKLSHGEGSASLDADALGAVQVQALGPNGTVLTSTDVWLTNEAKPMTPPNAGFALYTDRAPLNSSGTVRALVVSTTEGGHALLTLETDRIHVARAVEMQGRARFVELPLNAALAPNCFLNVFRVEHLRPMQTTRELRVKGASQELPVHVRFGVAATEPGKTIPLTVEAKGAPAQSEVAVTVVDEAVFAIEAEQTNFLEFFGQRRRELRVQTQSSLNERSFRPRPVPADKQPAAVQTQTIEDVVFSEEPTARRKDDAAEGAGLANKVVAAPAPAVEAKKEMSAPKRAMGAKAQEADSRDEAGAAEPKARTNFATSSGWFPSLGGRVGTALTTPVTFSDSLTSWRAIAYVVTDGAQLGVGRGTVRTEKSLMVRLQAPRFFTEKDEVTLSAVVNSRLPQATEVEVSVSAPGLKPLGETSRRLKIESGKELRFDARFVVVEPGEHSVRAVVKSSAASDAMEMKLVTNVHGSAQRTFLAGRLSDRFSFDLELPAKRKPSMTRLELALSPSLLSVIFDALPYLAQYPYGCVEQTLSRFVPATIAFRAAKDFKVPTTRVPDNLVDMVDAGLKRLYGFQHSDGGWGWWQTDTTNKWMSAYVVYGLGLAKEAKVNVDSSVLSRGRSYLTQALGGALNTPETHAFMVFALAKTGGAPKPAIDAAFAYRTKLTPRGRALVALALLAQKDQRARIAVENLDDVVKAAAARADASVGDANDAWSTSAAIEATSYTLMAMAEYDLKSPNLKPLTDFLVLRRNGGKWRSTRDTAFAVYALAELARLESAQLKDGSFVITVNGREVKRLSFAKGGADLTEPLVLADSAFHAGKNVVDVRRDGGATGYWSAQFDVYNQNDFIKGVGGDVKVTRKYTLLGKPSTDPASAPTEYGMPVESGTRVRVDVEIKANKAVEYVMLEDLKPAGLEAVMQKSGPEVCNFACAHAELRPDRVAMFISSLPVGVTKLSYELRAEVPGKFAALPSRFEAMYAPEIQATSDEMRFEVRDAPTENVAGK